MGSSCENTEKKERGGKRKRVLGKRKREISRRSAEPGGRADPGGFNEFARARGGRDLGRAT